MKLVDLPRYVKAAEDFVKRNPLGYSYTGFISTEDPNVLAEAKMLSLTHPPPSNPAAAWSQPAKWTWYWSDIPRLNTSPEEQLARLGGGNRTEMTLGWMLQLIIALEADGWVGTRGSGWNRLIDQLRCVWVAGCKKPILEVGSKGSWVRTGDLTQPNAGYGPSHLIYRRSLLTYWIFTEVLWSISSIFTLLSNSGAS